MLIATEPVRERVTIFFLLFRSGALCAVTRIFCCLSTETFARQRRRRLNVNVTKCLLSDSDLFVSRRVFSGERLYNSSSTDWRSRRTSIVRVYRRDREFTFSFCVVVPFRCSTLRRAAIVDPKRNRERSKRDSRTQRSPRSWSIADLFLLLLCTAESELPYLRTNILLLPFIRAGSESPVAVVHERT